MNRDKRFDLSDISNLEGMEVDEFNKVIEEAASYTITTPNRKDLKFPLYENLYRVSEIVSIKMMINQGDAFMSVLEVNKRRPLLSYEMLERLTCNHIHDKKLSVRS